MIKEVTMYSVVCDRCGKTYGVDDGILREMKANGLISISQYNDIYSNNTIYEGTCEIYKTSNV